jgi:hypothetical protein
VASGVRPLRRPLRAVEGPGLPGGPPPLSLLPPLFSSGWALQADAHALPSLPLLLCLSRSLYKSVLSLDSPSSAFFSASSSIPPPSSVLLGQFPLPCVCVRARDCTVTQPARRAGAGCVGRPGAAAADARGHRLGRAPRTQERQHAPPSRILSCGAPQSSIDSASSCAGATGVAAARRPATRRGGRTPAAVAAAAAAVALEGGGGEGCVRGRKIERKVQRGSSLFRILLKV